MSQTESGVAEQMVGMSIRAMESLSRLLASGAKNLAVFLFSVAKGTKQYRGITSVKQLLDGGHELVTLELNKNELREFCVHAKKNDIPCTVIHDKRLYQDIVPVLVRKTDAERAFGGRGSTGSISRSNLRPSVRAKIHNIQSARRAAQQPRIVPPPAQTPAWNPRDDVMMEAMRQFLVALTTLTQEVTKQPVHNVQPTQARSARGDSFRGERTESRESTRTRMARAKQAQAQSHSQSRTPAQPTKAQAIKPRGGRGGR